MSIYTQEIYYTVYRTVNLVNGKEYIGVHITDNPKDSYLGSGTILQLAVKKHGKENFKKEILYVFDNPEDMIAKEAELVNEEYVKREDTYNLTGGGNCRKFMSDEHKEKLRQANIGKKGRKMSESHKELLRRVHKNKIVSEETKLKMSKAWESRIVSEETKRKQSETRRGADNGMFGKTHTIETRTKISKTKRDSVKHLTCPYCNKEGDVGNMNRWHFENCKLKDLTLQSCENFIDDTISPQ